MIEDTRLVGQSVFASSLHGAGFGCKRAGIARAHIRTPKFLGWHRGDPPPRAPPEPVCPPSTPFKMQQDFALGYARAAHVPVAQQLAWRTVQYLVLGSPRRRASLARACSSRARNQTRETLTSRTRRIRYTGQTTARLSAPARMCELSLSSSYPPEQLVQLGGRTRLTPPNGKNNPPSLAKRGLNALVTLDIRSELGCPEVRSGGRSGGESATGVPVPEATVY